jgi:hypothetical protein
MEHTSKKSHKNSSLQLSVQNSNQKSFGSPPKNKSQILSQLSLIQSAKETNDNPYKQPNIIYLEQLMQESIYKPSLNSAKTS